MPPENAPFQVLPCCLEVPSEFLPRARYALEMLLLPLNVTPQWVAVENLIGRGLYYGISPPTSGDFISFKLAPQTIEYFERGVPLSLSSVTWDEWRDHSVPFLFPGITGASGIERHDVIAATFFWLSGWQEVTNRSRDIHGRFPYESSLQRALDVPDIPVVDVYRALLRERLERAGIPVNPRKWGGHVWAMCPTHDIDALHKLRSGMIFHEIVHHFVLNKGSHSLDTRLRRLGRLALDVVTRRDALFAGLDEILQAELERSVTATFFLKAGATDRHDVSYKLSGRKLKRWIERVFETGCEIGLHPSYHAHTHSKWLSREKASLLELVGRDIMSIRQHYLRYDVPFTTRLHEENGFKIDATLGFAEREGFRRATCLPFAIYDLRRNRPTSVWEMPLAIMDTTLFGYRQLCVEDAIEQSKRLMDTCKMFGGVMVGLWHNTIYDRDDFPGWNRHFEKSLDYAREHGALVASLSEALHSWSTFSYEEGATE